MTRGREIVSQRRVAVEGAWAKVDEDEERLEEEEDLLEVRLVEGVWGKREVGSTLAAREEARVVTILEVVMMIWFCFVLVVLMCVFWWLVGWLVGF
jgi:hypothetical protein